MNKIKSGTKIIYRKEPYECLKSEFVNPGKGKPFVRLQIRSLSSNRVLEKTFKSMGSIIITDSILEIRSIYIYNDRNFWFFMGEEGYDQFCISKERIKDQVDLIPNQLRCDVIFWKDRPISIRLPKFVTLKVIHTVDKKEFGDRCVGEWKSVILQTGAIIKVPYFIRVGDTIKINTKERTYESRCRVRSR